MHTNLYCYGDKQTSPWFKAHVVLAYSGEQTAAHIEESLLIAIQELASLQLHDPQAEYDSA